MSLRLPMLFLAFALLPLAVLTNAPFAKPMTAETTPENASATDVDRFSDAFAPAVAVKAFTFPADEQDLGFTSRLVPSFESGVTQLFTLDGAEPRGAFFALRALPDRDAYADWLAQRLIEIVAEKQAAAPPAPMVRFVLPEPEPPPLRAIDVIPMYDIWVTLLRDQPRPRRADEFIPVFKRIFIEEGVPPDLAWLPEIESRFNPRAHNSIGARGLFQFMPGTALEQGLRLRPYDERIHPEKSARAAAILLRRLHERFDSWPLALAAYNAGENRVQRTLDARDATTFAEIAHALPAETRLYVPRVLATLAVREGYDPALLAAPRVAFAE